ncbi:leucine--tRNA ligase [Halovivax limisalsi]|uniref:leucine--tRNA ligase n=1 Tax=Halovivax limisalsi TaxID=1453760 RepID=UPI001FFC85DD|nr:leucine--tRNA ligase [Halovivax limisalsi]
MSYDPQTLEARWRERWAESGRYEADPDERDDEDVTFVTVPYPYPNGGMHIGHARTYTVPDVYARYRRQRGDNVLFPIAWHVTGTPIVGAVERLKAGDPHQIDSLQNAFGVPEADLAELETPMGFARYFIENHYKAGMRQLGLSIDWRREFTTSDERYSKFIAWQYETLRERGLLEKGLHPVNYCTNEAQPVTTHDIYEGETAEFQEYSLVKFEGDAPGEAGDGVVFPMATLRPETVRGVTNAFVDPDAEYVRARVGSDEADESAGVSESAESETWIVSREATEKLELQARDVEVVASFDGSALVGGRVRNPVTDEAIPILPASFVDTDSATGVVMSVPAHSPDDWIALEAAKDRADDLAEYGLDPDEIRTIEPRPVLTVEGYGEYPAKEALEDHGVDPELDENGVGSTDERDVEPSDESAIEDATQELYNREFHRGELLEGYGEFAGEVVADVRDDLDAHYQERGAFDSMYDFAEAVICRCGGDVEVAEQETWFLRYNDADWQEKAHRAIENLAAVPENTKPQYDHAVDWLEEWPCIRNYGLGTRLPWDDEFVIEPLSDSTIYTAYYTIAHLIEDVPVEALDRDFFDTLLLGPAAADDPDDTALELREEFEYWYPVSVRCSANDLISNHLTFFLYHHAELFEPAKWPEGITVMGMGLLEGESMSSSRGHVVLPDEAIERYGADTVRFFLCNSAEPWQDFDWRAAAVGSTRDQLERFWTRAEELVAADSGERGERRPADAASGPHPHATDRDLERIDRWLLAKLQETVREVTDAMEDFETRTASQAAFYRFEEHLTWYRRRAALDRPGARVTLRTVLETRLRLLAPFVPFMANELHERLAGDPAEDVPWPEPVPQFEDDAVVAAEGLIRDLVDDVRDIVDVTETDPETIRVYTAADWKREVFDTVVEVGPDQGRVMSAVMESETLRERGDAVNDLVGDLIAFVRERDDERLATLSDIDERSVYADAAAFLEVEFDAAVEVYAEGDAAAEADGKAAQAQPFRPAIRIE